jgi:hypothetical protein
MPQVELELGYFCPTPRKGKIADIDTISPLASGVSTVPVWFVLSWSSGIIDQHEKTIIHSQNLSSCEVIEKRIRELFVRMENLNVQQFLHVASTILTNLRLRERHQRSQFYLFEALGKNSQYLAAQQPPAPAPGAQDAHAPAHKGKAK